MPQAGHVLDKLPKRLRPRAKPALREIMYAPRKAEAERGIDAFVAEFEALASARRHLREL